MGKGIALEFRKRYPEMYKRRCNQGNLRPGDIYAWWDPGCCRWIYNLGTQTSWKTKATPEYLRLSLRKI